MPAYAEVAESIAEEIESGAYPPGTALPTTSELQERFGVSQITIRSAIGALKQRGLVYNSSIGKRRVLLVRGTGRTTFYPTDALRPGRKVSQYDVFSENAHKAGKEPSKSFEMRIEHPPAEVASRLGLDRNGLVVVRSVRQILDGEPWSLEASYYPRDLAHEVGLDVSYDIPQGTIRALADAGYVETTHVDELTDENADEHTADALGIPANYPVMVQIRTAATNKRVTRVTRYITIGKRVRFVWQVGTDAGMSVIAETLRTVEDR